MGFQTIMDRGVLLTIDDRLNETKGITIYGTDKK